MSDIKMHTLISLIGLSGTNDRLLGDISLHGMSPISETPDISITYFDF